MIVKNHSKSDNKNPCFIAIEGTLSSTTTKQERRIKTSSQTSKR